MKRPDLEFARASGWTISRTRKGHVRLVHPVAGIVIASATPGDRRASANSIAMLKRALRRAGRDPPGTTLDQTRSRSNGA